MTFCQAVSRQSGSQWSYWAGGLLKTVKTISVKGAYLDKLDFKQLTVRATVVYTDPERAIWVIGTRNGAKCGKTYTVDFEREEKICMRIKWVDIYEINLLQEHDGHYTD